MFDAASPVSSSELVRILAPVVKRERHDSTDSSTLTCDDDDISTNEDYDADTVEQAPREIKNDRSKQMRDVDKLDRYEDAITGLQDVLKAAKGEVKHLDARLKKAMMSNASKSDQIEALEDEVKSLKKQAERDRTTITAGKSERGRILEQLEACRRQKQEVVEGLKKFQDLMGA